MRFLILLSTSLILFSCKNTTRSRIEKKFVVDSAWHQKNPNGIPPDIEGKNWVLVNGSVFTTAKLMNPLQQFESARCLK
jgi:hypothetical protein